MNSTTQPALLLANRVAAQFSALPQVAAVVLAGSHTTQLAEAGSDIDLYVYWHTEIPFDTRKAIAETAATRVEVGNRFWEPGDEWIDAESGIHVDVMFRHTNWIEQQLARVLVHHEACVGYSTCFWHNVLTSTLLFDKNGWFAALQTQAQLPYPETLQQNIIAKNYPILRDNLSSYLHQIEKAVRRDDNISTNHRITALLASYFDIIFAINRLPHPGEKRLVQVAKTRCKALPIAMQSQISQLLAAAATESDIIHAVNTLIDGLDNLLKKQGLFQPKNNTV